MIKQSSPQWLTQAAGAPLRAGQASSQHVTSMDADEAGVKKDTGMGSSCSLEPNARSGAELALARGGQDGDTPSCREAVLRSLVETGFDSALLVAPQLHTAALVQAVLPLLAPSAPFAVFSPSPQPLAECLSQLQVSLAWPMRWIGARLASSPH